MHRTVYPGNRGQRRPSSVLLADFLYVFRALEEKLGVPVAKVLEQRDYTVFTVNNLADAIAEDYPEIMQ